MNNIITGPQQRKCFCTPSFVEKTLRKIDKFGHPITLTHEDEDSFKSSFGGVMTILTIIGLVVFFGLEVQRALDQSKYNITTSRQIRNYYYDNTEYNIDYKAFDFAVRLSYVGTQNVNIEQYFSINFYDYFYDLKENYTEGEFPRTIVQPKLEKIKCTSDRLGGFTSGIDDSSKFWCTKRTNYTVKGGMVNAKIKYIQMALNYCQNETLQTTFPNLTCRPESEARTLLADIVLYIKYSEQYIDTGDFENPIKSYLKQIQVQMTNDTEVRFFSLGQNYAVLQDSWLYSSKDEKNLTFTTVTPVYTYKKMRPQTIYQIFLLQDDNVYTTSRKVYNLLDVLSTVGGFASIITFAKKNFKVFYPPSFQWCSPSEKKINEQDGVLNGNKAKQKITNLEQQALVQKLQSHTTFKYSIFSYFFAVLYCKKNDIRYRLYLQGKQKLQKKLSLFKYLKTVRNTDSYMSLTLAPFQKKSIPYLPKNLITLSRNPSTLANLSSKMTVQDMVKELFLDSQSSQLTQKIIESIQPQTQIELNRSQSMKKSKERKKKTDKSSKTLKEALTDFSILPKIESKKQQKADNPMSDNENDQDLLMKLKKSSSKTISSKKKKEQEQSI
eukprot:403362181